MGRRQITPLTYLNTYTFVKYLTFHDLLFFIGVRSSCTRDIPFLKTKQVTDFTPHRTSSMSHCPQLTYCLTYWVTYRMVRLRSLGSVVDTSLRILIVQTPGSLGRVDSKVLRKTLRSYCYGKRHHPRPGRSSGKVISFQQENQEFSTTNKCTCTVPTSSRPKLDSLQTSTFSHK